MGPGPGQQSGLDQKNLILAVVLSIAIMLGYMFFVAEPQQEKAKQEALRQQQKTEQVEPNAPATVPGAPAIPSAPTTGTGTAAPPVLPDRATVLARGKRVQIDTKRLKGSVSLVGGRLDDLTLNDYREEVEPDSPKITMLSPPGAAGAYYAQFGWVATDEKVRMPGADDLWQTHDTRVTAGRPAVISWSNGQGLVFEKVIAVDANYMFTVTQRVRNTGGAPVTLSPFGLVTRAGTPKTRGYYILHEGPIGVFDETLKEIDYTDLQKDGNVEIGSKGGWIGFTDHYWLTAIVPQADQAVQGRFLHWTTPGGTPDSPADRYQVDLRGQPVTIPAGGTAESTIRLFAGAKEVRLLDSYQDQFNIARFDRAVDFGWFYFLTKPIFYVLDFFYRHVGNFGVAIIMLTILIKALFFPLAQKSYKAMSRLKALQPKMTEIREKFKDDRARQNQEMMELYKRENANPMAGCLPIVVQIPVFFSLYKVLFVTIEMRHAPFFGWIQDLSSPDPLGVLSLFGAIPWDVPAMLHPVNIGIWPIIMGCTMWLQQRLNPAPADPTQAKIMMLLPFVFTFILGRFAAGLVIYWTCNNLLSITQQWVIMRRMGVKVGGGTSGGTSTGTKAKTKAT